MKFYLDEDTSRHRLVTALRSHSIDVVTSLEAGMNSTDDEAQLTFRRSVRAHPPYFERS